MKPLNVTLRSLGASVTGAQHSSHADHPIIVLNLDYGILWVNQAFEKTFGFTLHEVKGKRPGVLLHGPETDPSAIEELRTKIRGHQPFDIELLEYSKKRNRYWMRVKGQPLFGRAGNCIGFCIIRERLTCGKVAQQAFSVSRVGDGPLVRPVSSAKSGDISPLANPMRRGVWKKTGLRLLRLADALAATLLEQVGELTNMVHVNRKTDASLVSDIRGLIDQIEMARPITIELDSELFAEKQLSKKCKLNVFRVLQEQLGNIAKFSGATEAKISLRVADRKIFLDIHDNGRPVDASQKERGICVTDILSCAEMNDGRAVLETRSGAGSILRVEFYMPVYKPAFRTPVRTWSTAGAVSMARGTKMC